MSFFDKDLEAQKASTTSLPISGTSRKSNLSELTDEAFTKLSTFANNLQELQRAVKIMGTKRDTPQLRSRVESLMPQTDTLKDKLDQVIDEIALLSQMNSFSPHNKFNEDKLRKEFNLLMDDYHSARRKYNELKVSIQVTEDTPLLAVVEEEEPHDYDATQQQVQEQVQRIPQQELDFHTILAEERANEIGKIHGTVEEVNAIFKQLGYLVQEQGVQVDTIENNIQNLSTNTQQASQQFKKAEEYQRKKNKCSMILLIVLSIIALVVFLVIIS